MNSKKKKTTKVSTKSEKNKHDQSIPTQPLVTASSSFKWINDCCDRYLPLFHICLSAFLKKKKKTLENIFFRLHMPSNLDLVAEKRIIQKNFNWECFPTDRVNLVCLKIHLRMNWRVDCWWEATAHRTEKKNEMNEKQEVIPNTFMYKMK